MKKLILLVPFVMLLAACTTPIEQVAYDTVVGAKAFTDTTKKQHPECATGATSTVCVGLAKAVAAKDLIIDVAEVACSGPDFDNGGKCDFPAKGTPAYTQAVAKIQAAINSYNQTATDLKKLL